MFKHQCIFPEASSLAPIYIATSRHEGLQPSTSEKSLDFCWDHSLAPDSCMKFNFITISSVCRHNWFQDLHYFLCSWFYDTCPRSNNKAELNFLCILINACICGRSLNVFSMGIPIFQLCFLIAPTTSSTVLSCSSYVSDEVSFRSISRKYFYILKPHCWQTCQWVLSHIGLRVPWDLLNILGISVDS